MSSSTVRERRWHFTPRQSALCAVAVVLIILGGFLAWREVGLAGDSVRWVQHTFRVLLQIDRISAKLTETETAQRDYLFAGRQDSAQAFVDASTAVPVEIEKLRALTADNARAQKGVEELRALATRRLSEMATTVELQKTQGPDAALRNVQANLAAGTRDRVTALFEAMRANEGVLLDSRLADRDEHLTRAFVGALALTGLSALLFAVLIASLNRSLRRQKLAELAAQENEERLRVTLESIGDAVIATDVGGKVVYLNPVARALTGWVNQDALGLPLEQIFRIVNEYSRDIVESPISKVMREGKIVGLANHTILIARDGSERPIDDSGAPIRDGEGELMGIVLVFRDVSARRMSEQSRERMLRAEAARSSAESANRAKDEFLAIVSHELRSPLAAAVSWVELLKSGTLSAADHTRALDTIDRNLRVLTRLVSDLLDVSRIVAGKLMIERVPADVGLLLLRAVADHRVLAGEKGIELICDPCESLIAMVDPDRLEQVLTNLLSNAIRFTPKGGRIDVSVAVAGGALEIEVRDTGQGIATEFLPHVFERFRQAEAPFERGRGGMGLGLAIARHLIEQHGGSISADSAGVGRGATFRVRLPLYDATAPLVATTSRPVATSGQVLAGIDILFVEDHEDMREAVAHRLRSRGARVAVAASVSEALQLYRENRPTLLISDLGLPQESGFKLIEIVRREDAKHGVHTPAIAVTGFVSGENRREALDAGFDEHLSKPIVFNVLIEKALGLLARREANGSGAS
jgi:PAS domain S-box-containing protein